MDYQPPHEVRDQGKLNSMIEALKNGAELPPVIVCGEVAFSGSHRLAAYDSLEMSPSVIEIDDDDIKAGMEHIGLDPMYDEIDRFDDFEQALVDLKIVYR